MNRKFEMGTFVRFIYQRFSFMLASNEGHVVEVEECISNTIVMPDHDMESVKLYHYRDLFLLCFILLTIAMIAVEIEMRFKHKNHI